MEKKYTQYDHNNNNYTTVKYYESLMCNYNYYNLYLKKVTKNKIYNIKISIREKI